ncbi:hypothetical protein [Komagataeibacter rhaeticus]|uniref:Uncharacterized protein n=1 Tax=Komagataeibacter rhaeticus TaxID=215221 RepID=A0A181CBR2_9PROT|nr:hypothetical protein [Komagataeibacter rhaeticus]ATU72348.1 hypothetical protein CT154_05355 [Komagataeibacter xylinus]QIP35733.1 hypothetical protein GWK63_09875 [Komagataeibacter rhaeticus]QOC45493.1 hypothetical protein ICJ78_09925 [Komagataeibacter rhaeticus]WPP22080.1 hypothetical protein SCD25_00840 [Komagataeibacter rhaeticus]SAY49004.1 hypothetical protein KRIGEM_01959 [Komagataeibacter rhaeticus]
MLSSLFPQWMPPWAQAVLLVGGILFALVWLFVPFAVFGVKGRLDSLAIQLDDLQAELRVMAMGLNTPSANPDPAPAARPPEPAPVWEPEPASRPAARPVPDPDADGHDIPAYERRATRAPQSAPVAPPRQPDPPPVRVREDGDEWPPRASIRPAAAPAPRPGREDEAPSLSEWSRGPSRAAPEPTGHRPLRASVWPPERGQRAEPTLRWPPRPDA